MTIIEEVKDRLSIFNNLYDVIRIIEPIEKKVLYSDENLQEGKERYCFCFWVKDKPCINCATMRAYVEKDTFVKLEYKEDKVFIVIATSVIVNDNTYIVELLKDISDNGLINDEKITNLKSAGKLINELNEKIIEDALTGIYNRTYINERLPVDIYNSTIDCKPISIIMADIDFFKDVYNNYGHAAADKVLVEFAKLLEKSIRKKVDWVGRYGGEEFLIVLNNTDSDKAYLTAENIRLAIEDKVFKYDDLEIKITSSFGVSSASKNKPNMEILIKNANQNLYKAKNSGRNKTIINL